MGKNLIGAEPHDARSVLQNELHEKSPIILKPLSGPDNSRGIESVSFYTGVGGLDFAAEQEGLKVLMATDNWQPAAINYPLNFSGDFLLKDILKISPQEILERVNRKPGEIDCVFAGAPCPPWSRLNRHRSNLNPDLNLTYYYLEMVKGLRPLTFVMEQVPSMGDDITLTAFHEFTCRLEEVLKDYHIEARAIRALNVGTPQDRTRWIFNGWRKETGILPSFPRPIKGSLQHLTIGAIAPEIDYIEIKSKRTLRKEHTEFFSTIPATEHVELHYKDGTHEPLSKRPDILLKAFGLPDDFKFHPDLSLAQIHRLIGNSVPVPLGRSVFREVVRQLRTLR
jgi:site-specific DNA-cytosine methylase